MGSCIPCRNKSTKNGDNTISIANTSNKYVPNKDNDQYFDRGVPKSNFITQNINEEVKIGTSNPKVGNTLSKHQLLASKDIHLPNINTPEELFKIKTTTEHKLTPEEKNEVFGKGANGFKEHYENPEIDSDVMNTAVKETSWIAHFKETIYAKWFDKTKRVGIDLLEAIEDVLVIAPKNRKSFMTIYDELKDKPADVVTSIWTYEPDPKIPGEIKLYKLINMALIIDAKNVFQDEMKGNISFATNFLKIYGITDVEHVIKHSIKFIRILNTALVDEGCKYNKEDRVTYRGVNVDIFKNIEADERYRVVTWSCSSESKDIAEFFRKGGKTPGSMTVFNIPKGCMNAGKINDFGVSCIPYEKETLIPPYTSITMLKEEIENSVKHYEVKVAFDNKGNYGEDDCPILEEDSEVRVRRYSFEREENINIDDISSILFGGYHPESRYL